VYWIELAKVGLSGRYIFANMVIHVVLNKNWGFLVDTKHPYFHRMFCDMEAVTEI
jgi:hypothetical protein